MANNPDKFQITPCAAPEWNEIHFPVLYLYHTSKGPMANQATLIEGKEPIGETIANSWLVYDGPGKDAMVVAQAQGLHIHVVNWQVSFSLAFQSTRFSGSTLEVKGIGVETGKWAIIGGTREFAMATGVIYKRLHEQRSDGNIIELTVRAFCPRFKGIRNPATKIGPWGGKGGDDMDITDASVIERLQSITIHSGTVIDSIQFSYIDYAGQTQSAGPWGGSGGHPHTVLLGESEFITQMSGTVGSFSGRTVITSIKFVTNLQTTHGPFGKEKGTPFSALEQPDSGVVVGFFARGGKWLDAIGAYMRPLRRSS